MKVILREIEPDDWLLGIRAAKWLNERPEQRDAIIAYGEGAETKDFFVKRYINGTISVVACSRDT